MIAIALFRNLNLGHAGSPTGSELIEAFGGTENARSFQTNGTIIFKAQDPPQAVSEALTKMRSNGYSHDLVLRSLDDVRAAVETAPPVDPKEDIYRQMMSFFDGALFPEDIPLPHRTSNGLVEIRGSGKGIVHSVCWKPKNTAGNVTAYLEKLLGVPVTTRTLGTMQRLLKTEQAG
jgi:uncharacterized protein (DUF1697 family)